MRFDSCFDPHQAFGAGSSVPPGNDLQPDPQEGRRLARRIMHACESHEQRLAEQIHGHAEQLFGVLLHLHAYEQIVDGPEDDAGPFAAAKKALGDVIAGVWELASQLRPTELLEAGLVSGLANLVNRWSGVARAEIEFVPPIHLTHVPQAIERSVHRVAEELLSNACRHSGAIRIRLTLQQTEDRLQLEVRDWGAGFDLTKMSDSHSGLERVRDWVTALGGCTVIDTAPHDGTRVAIELPLITQS